MGTDRYLSALAQHMEWADATVWKAVFVPNKLNDAALIDLLHHIHLVQHIFGQAWTSQPVRIRERAEFEGAEQLVAWGRGTHAQIQGFLAAADSQTLDRELRLPWAKYFEQQSNKEAHTHTVGESVLQVALHTAHHRGQVCRHLRQIGSEPPLVDFIAWLWSGRPTADWAYLEHRNQDA